MPRKTPRRKSTRRVRGGGYSVNPMQFVSVGHPIYQQYPGAGKDCAPGMSGGARGAKRSRRVRRSFKRSRRSLRTRGGYQLEVAPFSTEVITQAPPTPQAPQKGGRYEIQPGFLLDGGRDIGASSYGPVSSIACERGYANSLNMHGGASLGGADLAYHAPTAGHAPRFESHPGAVGGLMINVPYDARAMNPACTTTGGKRRYKRATRGKRNQRGGANYADSSAPFSPLTLSGITGRSDFDGSQRMLPMKF